MAGMLINRATRRIVIHATDTDVVVLGIAIAIVMNECELWLAFGH
jgi:hypothetical protein